VRGSLKRKTVSRKGADKRKTRGAKKKFKQFSLRLAVFLFFAPLRETVSVSCVNLPARD
jgi:hypothetical protein